MTEPMTAPTTSQVVIGYPDSSYVVRTYERQGDRWVQVREVPAKYRDVVQATMDGRIGWAE